MVKYIILLGILFVTQTIYAGTGNPWTKDSKYIEYGKNFKCVGRVVGKYDEKTEFMGSGIAIDDRNILTAAHIVKDSISCGFISYDGVVRKCKKVIYHKDFTEENFGKYDIAICVLDNDLDLPKYPELYTEDNEQGKMCSIAGYGYFGTFETGAINTDDHIRAGTNIIDMIEKDLLVCSPSPRFDKSLTELEFIIAHGDSGGGLFIDGKLAGINSGVMATDRKPNSSYTDESCHTRVSAYIDWIKENISR